MYNLYSYDGPVMQFDTCVHNHWKGTTYALTEKKAKSNLAYQFKKMFGYEPMAKITLPGNLVIDK